MVFFISVVDFKQNQMFTLLHMRQTSADTDYVKKLEAQLASERAAKKDLLAELQKLRMREVIYCKLSRYKFCISLSLILIYQ